MVAGTPVAAAGERSIRHRDQEAGLEVGSIPGLREGALLATDSFGWEEDLGVGNIPGLEEDLQERDMSVREGVLGAERRT